MTDTDSYIHVPSNNGFDNHVFTLPNGTEISKWGSLIMNPILRTEDLLLAVVLDGKITDPKGEVFKDLNDMFNRKNISTLSYITEDILLNLPDRPRSITLSGLIINQRIEVTVAKRLQRKQEQETMRRMFSGSALAQLNGKITMDAAHRAMQQGAVVASDRSGEINIHAFADEVLADHRKTDPAAASLRVVTQNDRIVWVGYTGDHISQGGYVGHLTLIDYVQRHPLITAMPS